MIKKVINKGANYVQEELSGFLKAFGRDYEKAGEEDENIILYKGRRKDKVSLLVGGGSGHEPIYTFLIGNGLGDASCAGNIFASPNPKMIADTAKMIDNGKGVIMVYGNYAGDNLNFDMAEELCEFEDVKTAHVRVMDDIAIKNKEDRRGIAGLLYYVMIAGAACDAGMDLDEVKRVVTKAQDNIATFGVAMSSCSIPGEDHSIFELPQDEMEYGMGLHGEPGVERAKFADAHTIVSRIYKELRDHSDIAEGDEINVLVNGFGSTTLLELLTVYNEVETMLSADGIKIYDTKVGSWGTSQEMAGFSITLFKLDDELKELYNKPCSSPYLTKGVIE